MGIQNVAIVYRPRKSEAKKLAETVAQFLKQKGCTCYSHPEQTLIKGTKKAKKSDIKKLDLVIVLGGDGTYLNAVRMLEGASTPVLGVNLGSLGFLTQTRKEKIKSTLSLVLKDKLEISERTMLDVSVVRNGKTRAKYLALNDIVFERGPISRLIYMSIHTGGTLVSELKADGLIVSTPTGSTAYNLAAGGPILHPNVPAIVLTPICPHSLTNRPITLSDMRAIEIRLTNEGQTAVFMVDGQRVEDLTNKDKIVVTKSKYKHHMLVTDEHNHFDVLRSKLRFGKRD